MPVYPFQEIEQKWQTFWRQQNLYRAPDLPHKKYYVLEMFPYPSGGDLHMGHLKNYTIGDVVARVYWMSGYEVLHPMGWDAFGLPAENAAIKHGIHPNTWTEGNIRAYKEHLHLLGISYDWNREIGTFWPSYYLCTQWLFLFLYKKGLAYRAKDYVNFCPRCKTVLANEQVIQGKCERCDTEVTKRPLEQWFFKITAYADRLLEDLKLLEGHWPESILKQQQNWIGRSEGTEILFSFAEDSSIKLPVFTTRADTLFGVTFLTIAPEHTILDKLLPFMTQENRDNVLRYREEALQRSEMERMAAERPKSGVETGLHVVHPYTGERLPLWVGDYVLVHYGTGIVMGVPAHDTRDFAFAKKYTLPIRPVVRPVQGKLPAPEDMDDAFIEKGIMENSGPFSGMPSDEGIRALQKDLAEKGLGGARVSYKLRDWLVSRQRYWGAPIPMIHCHHCGIVPVPESDLPVLLPEHVQSFLPTGRSPLEDIPEFMNTTCPACGGPARRDPDTMDTFVDSSWYYLRYIDPQNENAPFDPEKVKRWMPVDQYIGGAEHATKHLIYARFINKVLYDEGLVPHPEPFLSLFTQGLVHKAFLFCPQCFRPVGDQEVLTKGDKQIHESCGTDLERHVEMMSKSRGNVVPVGPFVKEYGADVARIAILFAAPPDKDFEWTDAIVKGAVHFLDRIWKLFTEIKPTLCTTVETGDMSGPEKTLYIRVQQTIQKVVEDLRSFRFNTAVAHLMTLLNHLETATDVRSTYLDYAWSMYVRLLAPIAPHISEELWERLGGKPSIFRIPLPEYDPAFLYEDQVKIPVQVNGKVRGVVEVPRGSTQDAVTDAALKVANVQKYVAGKSIVKIIYVQDKLLNIVVRT